MPVSIKVALSSVVFWPPTKTSALAILRMTSSPQTRCAFSSALKSLIFISGITSTTMASPLICSTETFMDAMPSACRLVRTCRNRSFFNTACRCSLLAKTTTVISGEREGDHVSEAGGAYVHLMIVLLCSFSVLLKHEVEQTASILATDGSGESRPSWPLGHVPARKYEAQKYSPST